MMTTWHKRVELARDTGAIQIPTGQEIHLPAGTEVFILQSLGGTYTVRTPYGEMARISEKDVDALGLPESEIKVRPKPTVFSEEAVWDELRTCFDPEIPVNIVALGLIYGLEVFDVEGGKRVKVTMTLTAPGCGMGDVLKVDIERKLEQLPEVAEVDVNVVLDPPWSPDKMSEEARLELGVM